MNNLLAIAAGGALGSVLRYGLGGAVTRIAGGGFPWGTLVVNALGSFAFGLLAYWLAERVPAESALRAFLLVGLLGAFTTFSTFSFETLGLLQQGEATKALANMLVSVLLCVALTWTGFMLAREFF
ncbi:MAG: fluoride efflux transporter CrcB [Gammaproteobacteria bacterium]|nr:fluoride efflux transporter CrcB [Gammaproteobacteria bacterium]